MSKEDIDYIWRMISIHRLEVLKRIMEVDGNKWRTGSTVATHLSGAKNT